MFKIEIVTAMITGVISGIIASICFYQILKRVKPKIAISPYVCIDKSDPNNPIHFVKFINKSRKVITRLDYVLQYMVIGEDTVHTIHEITPCKPKLRTLAMYNKHDDDAKYAVRISHIIPESQYPMTENARLLFTVLAEDPASGTTTCLTKEFKAKDIVEGKHETKTSLAYVANKANTSSKAVALSSQNP